MIRPRLFFDLPVLYHRRGTRLECSSITFIFFILFISLGAKAQSDVPAAGEMIYRQGLLPSGEVLRGEREAGAEVKGSDAACVNCHRRSGLGSVEGRITIPPITGKYLFQVGSRNTARDNPSAQAPTLNQGPYTDVTLARAIREGIGADGRTLSYLMPRFKLDDAAMAALTLYLKSLTNDAVPGVTDDTLHFATIITPDADPVKRKAMLDVLERFFADKNEFIRGGARRLQSSREIMYRVTRKWQLHVWQLSGPPDTWQEQLHQRLLAEPVFAVISGLGGANWAPVHAFCEREAIPCLLPNVDLPVVAEQDFYPVYFSKGALLEAELMSHEIRDNKAHLGLHHVIQIFRKGDIGEAAAKAVHTAMSPIGLKVTNYELKGGKEKQELVKSLRQVRAGDVLILWLRPEDLASLPTTTTQSSVVYVSGLMGGLESSPLPPAWRAIAHLTYPFDLPQLRRFRMNYPLGWFRIRQVQVVDERVQSDTYLACSILAETLGEMLDSFVRDYLVERVEVMLSHRLITGYYPRLGLAPGQRFASKGGYIVHFAEAQGARLVADSAWITP